MTSTRFLLAQLVERRIQSILRDAKQLQAAMKPFEISVRYNLLRMENGLEDAKLAAEQICTFLTEHGEGETKQDDLPNLAEKP